MSDILDAKGEIINFRGDTRLRPENCIYRYTPEEIKIITKSYQSKEYFIENGLELVTLNKGLSHIALRDYQKEALERFSKNRFNILMWTRQSGKTTCVALEALYTAMFKEFQNIVILANKDRVAMKILRRIKNIIKTIPIFLQQGLVDLNEHSISFENGSILSCAATSESAIRSDTCNLLIMDEVAHIPSRLWREFYTSSYPTISSSENSRIILISTPKGQNHLYKLFSDAEKGLNSYIPYRLTYLDAKIPGQDKQWAEKTKADIGEREFAQEYECSFLGSTNTLIDTIHLENLVYQQPIPVSKELEEKINFKPHLEYLSLYELPKEKHIYSIGVDTSKLSEDISGDAMCIQILDITNIPFIQVGTYYIPDNISITYLDFPEIIYQLAMFYNNGIIFIENNEIGQEVADIIWMDYEYGSLYFEKQNLGGFRTTKKTKRLGASNLKLFIENGKLILNDYTTIAQLTTFIKVKNSYKADSNKYDDAVMALFAALFVLQVPDYKSEKNRIDLIKTVKFDEELELGTAFFVDPNETFDMDKLFSVEPQYIPRNY